MSQAGKGSLWWEYLRSKAMGASGKAIADAVAGRSRSGMSPKEYGMALRGKRK